MLERLNNPKSVFIWWIALGILLGLGFSQIIGSFMVGIPMGVALSLLIGKVIYQISRTFNRFGA